MFPELLISGIVYQITLWRLTVNAFKNHLDKYWTNQDVVYDYKSDLKGTRRSTCLCLMLYYLRCGQRGIPVPVTSHWIGLDSWNLRILFPGIAEKHTHTNIELYCCYHLVDSSSHTLHVYKYMQVRLNCAVLY